MHSLQFFPMSITVIQLLFFDLLIRLYVNSWGRDKNK